jgi:hypothetical protein
MVGGLLKQWLRDLPDPIIGDYLGALPPLQGDEEAQVVDAELFKDTIHYEKVLQSLPPSNAALLLDLAQFLQRMGAEDIVAKTKMGVDNLCTVFSQTIMRNPSLDPFCLLKGQPREHRFLLNLVRQIDQLSVIK